MLDRTKSLLLNQGYQPFEIINCKKAICMHFLNKVDIVEEYKNLWLNSPSISINIPAVVRINKNISYTNNNFLVRFSRSNVYIRDGYKCQYCGEEKNITDLTLDHVVPKSYGGKRTWNNIVTSCFRCNSRKGNKFLKDSGMTLLTNPKQPTLRELNKIKLREKIPNEWEKWFF